MNKKHGVTLMENLVTIVLLAVIIMGTVGGFLIAKTGSIRAEHRTIAMGIIREMLEMESACRWEGGDASGYVNSAPAPRIINGITYTITPDPLPAQDAGHGSPCKRVGFRVQWNEPILGGVVPCTERAVTDIAQHN